MFEVNLPTTTTSVDGATFTPSTPVVRLRVYSIDPRRRRRRRLGVDRIRTQIVRRRGTLWARYRCRRSKSIRRQNGRAPWRSAVSRFFRPSVRFLSCPPTFFWLVRSPSLTVSLLDKQRRYVGRAAARMSNCCRAAGEGGFDHAASLQIVSGLR